MKKIKKTTLLSDVYSRWFNRNYKSSVDSQAMDDIENLICALESEIQRADDAGLMFKTLENAVGTLKDDRICILCKGYCGKCRDFEEFKFDKSRFRNEEDV